MTQRKCVIIHTDGACSGNPGPGGYGVVLRYGNRRRELSAGYRRTTNARMELLGPIVGLDALKEPCSVFLYCDAKYVVEMMDQGWPQRWAAKGWRRANKVKVANQDLWEALLRAASRHEVTFVWTKGHAGEPDNERCHDLATCAAHSLSLLVDEGYESTGDASPSQGTLGVVSATQQR